MVAWHQQLKFTVKFPEAPDERTARQYYLDTACLHHPVPITAPPAGLKFSAYCRFRPRASPDLAIYDVTWPRTLAARELPSHRRPTSQSQTAYRTWLFSAWIIDATLMQRLNRRCPRRNISWARDTSRWQSGICARVTKCSPNLVNVRYKGQATQPQRTCLSTKASVPGTQIFTLKPFAPHRNDMEALL